MDTPGHMMLAAGACASVARVLKTPRLVIGLAGLYGFALGGVNDLIPWIAYLRGEAPMWSPLYHYWHHWNHWQLLGPTALHWAVDWLFHRRQGGWVSYAWALEIGFWSLAAVLIWYAFFKRRKAETRFPVPDS
jgi:hypothetical protein